MIMTDLTDKGFARREEALNFDDACAALDWLARLRGIMTNPIVTRRRLHLVSAGGLWERRARTGTSASGTRSSS